MWTLARKALEWNRKRCLELVELLVLTALVGFFIGSLGGFVARILHRRISSGFGVSYRTHTHVHNPLTRQTFNRMQSTSSKIK